LRNQSTAHASRGGDPFRVGDRFELVGAPPPPGFDSHRDGVCVHRRGTILYLSPNLPGLLEKGSSVDLVGATIAELVTADDPGRAATLAAVASGRDAPPTLVAFRGAAGREVRFELTFARTNDATTPMDVIWFRACGNHGPASEENDERMPTQVGEKMATVRGPGRPTVLICDDEARLGALTAGLLTEYGFSPITVGTGEAALDALGKGEPDVDVVLLDVNLSAGQSARDVLAAMKDRGARARVILTSGLAEEDVDQDLVQHPSVVGYVPKPYGVDQLVQSINRALGL
jgi:CheY-like chemotaxis protein